jgi:hypothetical protein
MMAVTTGREEDFVTHDAATAAAVSAVRHQPTESVEVTFAARISRGHAKDCTTSANLT